MKAFWAIFGLSGSSRQGWFLFRMEIGDNGLGGPLFEPGL
jgi:hypothetical protein